MATFPAYAEVVMDGYDEEPDYNPLRSPMDDGLAKQRARRTLPIVTRSATIKVPSKAHKLLFDAWAKTDINRATGWFDYHDCVDGQTKPARIVGGKYKWAPVNGIWLASCQLETLG